MKLEYWKSLFLISQNMRMIVQINGLESGSLKVLDNKVLWLSFDNGMNNKMNIAKSFAAFFNESFHEGMSEMNGQKLADSFILDFIHLTPVKLSLIKSYSEVAQFDLFYLLLADLKFLNEFSDNFSRYWCVIRGYSGALAKLKRDYSVKGSKKIHGYYFQKYGDRRPLRNDHWFEKKRWEFLDELHDIYSEKELNEFMYKYQLKLNENLKIYVTFIHKFIKDLKKLSKFPIVPIQS